MDSSWRYILPQLLIDADILLYQALTVSEREVEWEDDVWTLYAEHDQARQVFDEAVTRYTSKFPDCSYRLCFTDAGKNFRNEIYPPYKGNRKSTRKPLGFKDFKQWALESYPSVVKPHLEADDCLGILATRPGADAIIVSGDKDLRQIPCKHLDKDGTVITVTPADGYRFFLTQILTGDSVDGYPGIPGIGKVKAEKILSSVPEGEFVWPTIVDAYEAAGLTEEDALTQARMARILQWDDWDAEQQKVKLWTPIQ